MENEDYILTLTKIGERQNVIKHEYYLKIDVAKEIAMVENNEIARQIRRYFIEVERRYRNIIANPKNIFDCIRLALNQIEENKKRFRMLNYYQKITQNKLKRYSQK